MKDPTNNKSSMFLTSIPILVLMIGLVSSCSNNTTDGNNSKSSDREYEKIMELHREYDARLESLRLSKERTQGDPLLKKLSKQLRGTIKDTKDQNVLARIVIEGKIPFADDALDSIHDQKLLAKIAVAPDSGFVEEALMRLDDVSMLMSVATNINARMVQTSPNSPWKKLCGIDVFGEIQDRVPEGQLEFVALYFDPDNENQPLDDPLYPQVLSRMSEEAVEKIVARRADFIESERVHTAASGPMEQIHHEKLIAMLCSRILKFENREMAIKSLARLAEASEGYLAFWGKGFNRDWHATRDFLAHLRKMGCAGTLLSLVQHPTKIFVHRLSSEDMMDIAIHHPDKEERINAAKSREMTFG